MFLCREDYLQKPIIHLKLPQFEITLKDLSSKKVQDA